MVFVLIIHGQERKARSHFITRGRSSACGAAGWRFMLPALAEAGYRAYAPDQLSMGFTDTRPHAWPVNGHQSLVDHVHDFIEALCLDEVYLVGNSQGAYVAANMLLIILKR